MECSNDQIAFDLEKGIIKCLRRMGVELVNTTSGGEGVPGYSRTEEWKKNHSEKMKGRTNWRKGLTTPEHVRKKISESLKGRPGRSHTTEAKVKCSRSSSGRVWITNGVDNSRIRIPQEIPQGWYSGVTRKKGKG